MTYHLCPVSPTPIPAYSPAPHPALQPQGLLFDNCEDLRLSMSIGLLPPFSLRLMLASEQNTHAVARDHTVLAF